MLYILIYLIVVQGRGIKKMVVLHSAKYSVGKGVNPVLTLQSVLQGRKSRDMYFFILHIEL